MRVRLRVVGVHVSVDVIAVLMGMGVHLPPSWLAASVMPWSTPVRFISPSAIRITPTDSSSDAFWKANACRELADRIRAARERPRRPIGFDKGLLQLVLVTLLLGSAGVLGPYRRPEKPYDGPQDAVM